MASIFIRNLNKNLDPSLRVLSSSSRKNLVLNECNHFYPVVINRRRLSSSFISNSIINKRRLSSYTVLYNNIRKSYATSNAFDAELNDNKTNLAYESLISGQEIRQRQSNLISLTNEWLKKSTLISKNRSCQCSPLILIASCPPQFQANTNIPVYECKQSSEFTYFTGLHSGSSDQLTSDCVLVLFLEDSQNLDSLRSILFSTSRTKSDRLWHGPELQLQYKDWLNEICDDLQPLRELVPFLNKHIKNERRDLFLSSKSLQYRPELVTHLKFFMKHPSTSYDNDLDEKWSTSLGQSIKSVNVRDATTFIDQLRLIKSESEAKALKRVGRIGARALHDTILWSRQMVHSFPTFLESHIAAKFAFESKLAGARRLSFPSICAGGHRSTIIHYGRNDHVMNGQEENCWVLTDVGCEDVDGYCCDISRTWPLNLNNRNHPTSDKFEIQLQFYEALIGVQHELINSIQVGQTSLNDLNNLMFDIFAKILINFNLFEGSVSTSDVQGIVKRLCAHHVSHYIGLDIHDTPSISRSIPLQPGMCFSIEPGLYIPLEGLPIKPEFRNIGLRIEDDILIEPTNGLIINLSSDCPKLMI